MHFEDKTANPVEFPNPWILEPVPKEKREYDTTISNATDMSKKKSQNRLTMYGNNDAPCEQFYVPFY